jgi:hypothetical protein
MSDGHKQNVFVKNERRNEGRTAMEAGNVARAFIGLQNTGRIFEPLLANLLDPAQEQDRCRSI